MLAPNNYKDLKILSFNRKDISAEDFGKISLDKDILIEGLTKLKQIEGLEEGMIVSTCNRTEFIYYTKNNNAAFEIMELYNELTKGRLNELKLTPQLYSGIVAADHFVKVGVGAESRIIGDPDIPAQISQNRKLAAQNNVAGIMLKQLVEVLHKDVLPLPSVEKLRQGSVSAGHHLVQDIKPLLPSEKDNYLWDTELTNPDNLIGNLSEQDRIDPYAKERYKVLQLGTSEYAMGITKQFLNLDYYNEDRNRICILSKFQDQIDKVSKELNVKTRLRIQHELTSEDLADYRFIVIATDNPGSEPILSYDVAKKINHKILVADLTAVGSVDPKVLELPNVQVVSLPELEDKVNKTLGERKEMLQDVLAEIKEKILPGTSSPSQERLKAITSEMGTKPECQTKCGGVCGPRSMMEQMLVLEAKASKDNPELGTAI